MYDSYSMSHQILNSVKFNHLKRNWYKLFLKGEKQNKEQMNKMAEIRQRKKEKLLALVGNKAPTMGQVNPNFSTSDIELF